MRNVGKTEEADMSRSITIKFRNEEREIQIDRDYGWESDTNAWDVDWSWVGSEPVPPPTDEELEALELRIREILQESYYEGDD